MTEFEKYKFIQKPQRSIASMGIMYLSISVFLVSLVILIIGGDSLTLNKKIVLLSACAGSWLIGAAFTVGTAVCPGCKKIMTSSTKIVNYDEALFIRSTARKCGCTVIIPYNNGIKTSSYAVTYFECPFCSIVSVDNIG